MKLFLVLCLLFAVCWTGPAPRRHSNEEQVEEVEVEVRKVVHHEGDRVIKVIHEDGGERHHENHQKSCPNQLTPLYYLYNAAPYDDHYYTPILEDYTYLVLSGWKAKSSPGQVSMSSTDCHCNPKGYKPVVYLNGGPNTGGRPGNKNDRLYIVDEVEIEHMQKTAAYSPRGVYFFCSPKKDHCGASMPLKKYLKGKGNYYATNDVDGAKLVNAGATYQGTVCYIWPTTAIPEEFIKFNGNADIATHMRTCVGGFQKMG